MRNTTFLRATISLYFFFFFCQLYTFFEGRGEAFFFTLLYLGVIAREFRANIRDFPARPGTYIINIYYKFTIPSESPPPIVMKNVIDNKLRFYKSETFLFEGFKQKKKEISNLCFFLHVTRAFRR